MLGTSGLELAKNYLQAKRQCRAAIPATELLVSLYDVRYIRLDRYNRLDRYFRLDEGYDANLTLCEFKEVLSIWLLI